MIQVLPSGILNSGFSGIEEREVSFQAQEANLTEGRFAQALISAPHLPVVSGQFCPPQNGC